MTPEEREIVQKYCKHSVFNPNKSISSLKFGEENQILICENCGLELERQIPWHRFVTDENGEPAYCGDCGLLIEEGKQHSKSVKTPYGPEIWHESCYWGDDLYDRGFL